MKGIFKPRNIPWLFCLIMLVSGSVAGIRLGIWGVDAILQGEGMASAAFCLIMSMFFLAFGCLSILIFNVDRSAYLEVDDDNLRASFGWGTKISVPLGDIEDVHAERYFLTLWTKQKMYRISGVMNAVDVGAYILSRIPARVWKKDPAEESKKLRSEKKRSYVFLCLAVLFAVAMFANIGWCVLLTDGKELTEFTRHDDVIFLIFVFIELITVVGMCLFAARCGVAMHRRDRCVLTLLAVGAFENRKNGLEIYQEVLSVWYFRSATQRIVIYRDDGYSYVSESYTLDKGWCAVYPAPLAFETFQELDEDISFRFSDVILEKLP